MTEICDLALLSDLETSALVDRSGAIVWAAFPRFDSPACFAAMLHHDEAEAGVWRIAPTHGQATVTRRYRTGLILESTWESPLGQARVIDFMPTRDCSPEIVRIVEGIDGTVEFGSDLTLRFDYGSVVPWVRTIDGDTIAVAGPERMRLHSTVESHGHDFHTGAVFAVAAGERIPFVLDWHGSHLPLPPVVDAENSLARTTAFWDDWIAQTTYDGAYAEEVRASLVVLKGLTYAPTGGIVAAPTTSLPEAIGGGRNWDYRFCWLRDATYTLLALLESGHDTEAVAWRDWLLRAVAGDPGKVQIMYGVAGERRLHEQTLPWLTGHRGSAPVRVGNAAHDQFQLDVFGEVMDVFHQARCAGIPADRDSWSLQRLLLDVVDERWTEPDEGIWEIRGPRRHFTHSKVMAWVAFDRGVRGVEEFGLDGPVDHWRRVRDEIRAHVLAHGVDDRGVFTQSYGDSALDASALLLPLVGFLPADDERVRTTTEAIATDLVEDGYVLRYRTDSDVDGLAGGEGAFLLCSFWLAQNWVVQGQVERGRNLFERLLARRNDVGLLAEEVDPRTGELLGNMPQAFSHLALINTAMALCDQTDDGVTRRSRHE